LIYTFLVLQYAPTENDLFFIFFCTLQIRTRRTYLLLLDFLPYFASRLRELWFWSSAVFCCLSVLPLLSKETVNHVPASSFVS